MPASEITWDSRTGHSAGPSISFSPDCTKNGGLSESRRIAWLAHDHNVQIVPHGWNTAVGLAADLQFSAAIPVARYVEYLTPCVYIDEITTEPFRLVDEGLLMIPQLPGLGVEIDADKLAKFCPERVVFP
ncbi:MAG: enolase C-terminal domain-like protein [Isosphaeraceae bacterium]